MTFNKKIFLIWGILFGLGLVINLLLILVNHTYLLGWLWAGIGNIIFLLTTLFLLKIVVAKEHNHNFKKFGYAIFYSKLFINLLTQALLLIFLFLINYWVIGTWNNVYQAPINLFTFVAAVALPGIALLLSIFINNKKEVKQNNVR